MTQQAVSFDRRRMIALMAGATAATLAPRIAAAKTMRHMTPPPAVHEPQPLEGYVFLRPDEVRLLGAAVDRIIPTDELGPGAREAGVVVFLDRQLAGGYGANARMYLQGPFGPATPYQGYQLAITVADIYRICLEAIDRYCTDTYKSAFADLPAEHQDQILAGLDSLSKDLDSDDVPAKRFLSMLVHDTKRGYFADSIYGGNRGMAGWKLVGYPGNAVDYSEEILKANQLYKPASPPTGIIDIERDMGMTNG
ncbi:MAG: gluconate 2-dehydrogenase subunit 3 family protein [Rhizomicrobium sp.]